MNYYENIKEELINNEVYKKVKDYSKNKSDLKTYYNVGKMLSEAGKHYGEGIIKKYSIQLIQEVDKKFNTTNLKRMRQFYWMIEKGALMGHQLTWSHYKELIPLKDINKINYYINICENNLLLRDELKLKIKSNEYERLDNSTKEKLKKEHIGQIETYMNYIDKNLKTINQDKTIGIIITKKDNKFIMEYCSDKRILNTTYELQGV